MLIVFLFLVPLTLLSLLSAAFWQKAGRASVLPLFLSHAWKMPLPHSESCNKDSELRGAQSIIYAPAPSISVVVPILVP